MKIDEEVKITPKVEPTIKTNPDIDKFKMENEEKLNRALNGTIQREGKLVKTISDNPTKEEVLAEYDRLGGLITKCGLKVKTGSFYDFKAKAPRKEPELTFEAEIDGEIVEVDEDEAKAMKVVKEKTNKIKEKKLKK